MKFLALMGLAVIIQCASAAFESDADARRAKLAADRGRPADADQRAGADRAQNFQDTRRANALLEQAQPIFLESKTDAAVVEEEGALALDASPEEKDAEKITLISQDEEDQEDPQHAVEVSRKAAVLSGLVRKAMEVSFTDGKFKNVKCSVEALQAIGEYLNAHDGETRDTELAKPIRTKNMATIAAYDNAKGFTDAGFIDGLGSRNFQALTGQEPALATADHPADMSADGKRVVFDVILGANYLECTELLHLGCAKIATVIKGQNADMIKNLLGDNDYGVVAGVPTQMAGRRRRLSKESRSILSEMFGTAF